MYYSAEIAVDHITDHLPFRSTRKQWTGECRRARFSERKGAEKAIFSGNCLHRSVWEQDAAGSSPVTSTISSIHKGFNFTNTRFFILIRFYVRSRFSPAPFVMPFSARLNTWSRHLFWYRRRYSVCVISRVSPHIRQSDNR